MNRVNVFEPRNAVLIIAAVSALALIGAYLFQYVGGLPPCEMCLWQRPPYFIAIVASLGAYGLMLNAAHLDKIILLLISVAGLALAVNAGLGVYHAGVEWKWWPGPGTCSTIGVTARSAAELLEQLGTAPAVRCDEASWRLLGLSLAGYSALISAALATISTISVFRSSRGGQS